MNKIPKLTFFITLSVFLYGIAYADSIISNKIFGDRDCSEYSTKTFSGLSDYVKCKKGIDINKNESVFKKLKWGKKSSSFDPNKPCDEYSTKTMTGLANKIKCKKQSSK